MRHASRCQVAAWILIAGVAVAAAQSGSSGGSSSGGASSGGSSSTGFSPGTSSRGRSAPGGGVRGSSPSTQSPSLRGPGASTTSRPSIHPTQRNDPSVAPTKSEEEEEKDEKEEQQARGSGGTPTGGAGGGVSASGESQAGGSLLNLTAEQRAKVRRVIRIYSITPSDNGNFEWRPGALVPANVSLRPLPVELKEIIPDYQNFSYVMVGNRIAIVITEKREVDVVISG